MWRSGLLTTPGWSVEPPLPHVAAGIGRRYCQGEQSWRVQTLFPSKLPLNAPHSRVKGGHGTCSRRLSAAFGRCRTAGGVKQAATGLLVALLQNWFDCLWNIKRSTQHSLETGMAGGNYRNRREEFRWCVQKEFLRTRHAKATAYCIARFISRHDTYLLSTRDR